MTQCLDPNDQLNPNPPSHKATPTGTPYGVPPLEGEVVDDDAAEQAGDPLKSADTRDQRILELEEQVKRVSAEFENFRRRLQDEQKRRQVLMKEDLFKELLPISTTSTAAWTPGGKPLPSRHC